MGPVKASFLGIASSIAAGILIYSLILTIAWLASNNGRSAGGDAGMFIAMIITFFGIVPLSFFIGSIVTGFVSYYDLEYKSWFIFMAPAFSFSLFWLVFFIAELFINISKSSNDLSKTPIGAGLLFVSFPFLWYAVSLAGTFLGYYLRDRYAKWRHGY